MNIDETISYLDQALLTLKDPFVRDLAWVIGQPHLLELFNHKKVHFEDFETDR